MSTGGPESPELFGVFGDRTSFERFRSPEAFDHVLEGESLTLGVRDPAIGIENRTTLLEAEADVAVLFGEICADGDADPARTFLEDVRRRGRDALDDLNGSYLAAVDAGEERFVATDPVRSRECFYADVDGVRLFSTDPAPVAAAVPDPTLAIEPLLEFLLFSVVLGERTAVDGVARVPFDGLLGAESVTSLDRFVYRPASFDYERALTVRLERAVERRADYPGRHGVLLSGGYDSRALLALHRGLDVAYTLDRPANDEAAVAGRVANQYGIEHRSIPIDECYLNLDLDSIRHANGIKESLHIHQAGYEPELDADVMYHGLLFDTFLRGHFLPRDSVPLGSLEVPLGRLDSTPNPVEVILDRLGLLPVDDEVFRVRDDLPDDARTFARRAIQSEFDAYADRCDSIYNHIAVVGLANQPSTPFRYHLMDRYLESFVAIDADLLDWHLRTPPQYRNDETFLRVLRRIDPDVLKHRPPDRPYNAQLLNQVERFLRRKIPGLDPFAGPWPDRKRWWERLSLDERLFGSEPAIDRLSPRVKLRANDLSVWVSNATDLDVSPMEILRPHTLDPDASVDDGDAVHSAIRPTPLSGDD